MFFETYDDFLLFCEKKYTGLQELFICRQIKLQKIISDKIITNILKKDCYSYVVYENLKIDFYDLK